MSVDPLDWLNAALVQWDADNLRRRPRVRSGPCQAEVIVDGRRLVNFGSNDYLGLAGDPRLIEAAARAALDDGWGSGASPSIVGRSTWHDRLEAALAQFEGTEAALAFSSGYAANVGIIPALVDRGDQIFSDALNHASLIDGCRLSRAQVTIYPHADVAALEASLRDAPSTGRRMIVTESVFSMDGDVAPLDLIADLAERYGAMLLVDEAHATGVFGPTGRGVAEAMGPQTLARIDVRVGTLSKALASSGGFVAGRATLIDWLFNRARSYVFSTAPTAASAAAAVEALRIVRDEPERRVELLARADRLREALASEGWNLGRSMSPIVPVIVGSSDEALRLSAALASAGFFVPAIRPPTVAPGQSRLRISLTYRHDDAQLDGLRATLASARGRA